MTASWIQMPSSTSTPRAIAYLSPSLKHVATMSAPGPFEVASTIQSASIQRNPDPRHDLNPSTTASTREPVHIHSPASSDVDEDEIPLSVLHRAPRHHHLPPLPDLRFEQSYLKSIDKCETKWGVAYITFRDQVVFPLLQGTLWCLILDGWRFWNRNSQLSGQSVGARLRRWWWNVNNWKIPTLKKDKLAEDVKEYYVSEFANAGSD
ncbi:hypothetical protein BKA81DRAFT_362053 [Phyllosticta paracitricarpa]